MKTIDINDNMISVFKNGVFNKFKTDSCIELIYTLIQKQIIKSVAISNDGKWIGDDGNRKLLCGHFNSVLLVEMFKEMYVDHQDSIIMMLSCILTHMPIEERDQFRNFIMELIG